MLAPLFFTVAMATSIPTINLPASCRPAVAAALPEDKAQTYQSCISDEETARKQINQEWSKFTVAARGTCVDEATEFSPSYVDMLTCLEMSSGGEFSQGGVPVGSMSLGGSIVGSSTVVPSPMLGGPALPAQIGAPAPVALRRAPAGAGAAIADPATSGMVGAPGNDALLFRTPSLGHRGGSPRFTRAR